MYCIKFLLSLLKTTWTRVPGVWTRCDHQLLGVWLGTEEYGASGAVTSGRTERGHWPWLGLGLLPSSPPPPPLITSGVPEWWTFNDSIGNLRDHEHWVKTLYYNISQTVCFTRYLSRSFISAVLICATKYSSLHTSQNFGLGGIGNSRPRAWQYITEEDFQWTITPISTRHTYS